MKLLDIIYESIIDIEESHKLTPDEFIQRSKQINQNSDGTSKYTYDNVDYKNYSSKVMITCPKHGDFPQTPASHLRGKGCPLCYYEKPRHNQSNTQDFIDRSIKVHGKGRYDYSQVDYTNKENKITIICHKKDKDGNEHGPFIQKAGLHVRGAGCPICANNVNRLSKTDFINKANEKLGKGRYDYSEIDYVNSYTDVSIICHKKDKEGNEHGSFMMKPYSHLKGQGCPICKESMGERELKIILNRNNIKWVKQKIFNDCLSFRSKQNGKCYALSFDYYLPEYNTLIEFDGDFHFQKHHLDKVGNFKFQVLNDREKNNYTKLNDIKLIRLCRADMKNIETELMNGLNSKKQLYISPKYPQKGWRDNTIG